MSDYEKKLYVVLIIAALLCINRVYFSEHIEWGKDSKPYTDNFLKLLTGNNYEEMSEKYASGMSPDALKKKFDRFHNLFGKIKSYHYKRASASYDSRSGSLMGFSVSYQINFDSGKSCHGAFCIRVDPETNRPETGKISVFDVIGNPKNKEFSTIRLPLDFKY